MLDAKNPSWRDGPVHRRRHSPVPGHISLLKCIPRTKEETPSAWTRILAPGVSLDQLARRPLDPWVSYPPVRSVSKAPALSNSEILVDKTYSSPSISIIAAEPH